MTSVYKFSHFSYFNLFQITIIHFCPNVNHRCYYKKKKTLLFKKMYLNVPTCHILNFSTTASRSHYSAVVTTYRETRNLAAQLLTLGSRVVKQSQFQLPYQQPHQCQISCCGWTCHKYANRKVPSFSEGPSFVPLHHITSTYVKTIALLLFMFGLCCRICTVSIHIDSYIIFTK